MGALKLPAGHSLCHNSRWTHSPQTQSRNNMAAFWCYFQDFVGAQKIKDSTESKNVLKEVLQTTNRLVLAKTIGSLSKP